MTEPPAAEAESGPSLDAFEEAMRSLYRSGLYSFKFAKAEFLLHLKIVNQAIDAKNLDRPATAREREQYAVERLGAVIGDLGAEMTLVMGTARRLRRQPCQARCRAAAAERGLVSENSWRHYQSRHVPELLTQLARTLYRLELRTDRQFSADAPSPSMALEWLQRHGHYSQIWTAVWALQADLAAIAEGDKHEGSERFERFAISSLYWWGLYWVLLGRFRAYKDGIWILADGEDEEAAAEAVYEIGLLPNMGQLTESWLRITLRAIPDYELLPFREQITTDPFGRELLALWSVWLRSCQCDDIPAPTCTVHLLIGACNLYAKLIDDDWNQVVGWYRKRPTGFDHLARYRYLRELLGDRTDGD